MDCDLMPDVNWSRRITWSGFLESTMRIRSRSGFENCGGELNGIAYLGEFCVY